MGAEALALLESDRALPTEAVLVSLVNDLDELAGPTVLALDDYHVIDAPDIHEAVTFLLDHLPPQVTIAITTRADPPLPLARLRGRGELVELRAADLRFTAEEADAFLNHVMGLDLDPAHVAALEHRTEGWAAGLQLAALSARGRTDAGDSGGVAGFVDAFTGSHRFVLDYLVEEVLHSQPDDVRGFLLDTSVLQQLTGAAVRRADRPRRRPPDAGDPRARRTCSSSPSTTSGSGTATTTCSPTHCAPGSSPSTRTGCPSCTGPPAAGTPNTACSPTPSPTRSPAATPSARPIWSSSRWPTCASTARTAPCGSGCAPCPTTSSGGVPSWPPSWPGRGCPKATSTGPRRGSMTPNGHGTAVRPEAIDGVSAGSLAEAARARNEELRTLPATIAAYRASIAQARGDVDGTVAHARHALELAGPDDHLARGAAAGFLGLAAWAAGDPGTAVDTFSTAVASLHAAGNIADELGATVVLASMWLTRGRPRRHGGCTSGRSRSPNVIRARCCPRPVTCTSAWPTCSASRATSTRPRTTSRWPASSVTGRRCWRTVTAGTPPWPGLLQARGDLDGAVRMLDDAEPLYLPGFFPDVRPIPALRARVRIAQGRLADAWDWAHEHRVTAADPPAFLAEFNQLTLARLLIGQYRADRDQGGIEQARALLDRVADAAQAAGRAGSLVEARLVRALARHAAGDTDAAISDLAAALANGVPAGYLRLFLDEGPPMEELLRAAARPSPQRPPSTPPSCCARHRPAAATAAGRGPLRRRGPERPRARGAPAAGDRTHRAGDRPSPVRVGQYAAHPHQAHLHQAGREHPPGRGPPRHRTRPPVARRANHQPGHITW